MRAQKRAVSRARKKKTTSAKKLTQLPRLTLQAALQFLATLEVGRYRSQTPGLDAQLPITATDSQVLVEVRHAVKAIYQQLSDRQKPVFALRLTAHTFREIGKQLGISGSRVSHHYHRAMQKAVVQEQREKLAAALYLIEDFKKLSPEQLNVLGQSATAFSAACDSAFACHCGHAREAHIRWTNQHPRSFEGACFPGGMLHSCGCKEYTWHGDKRPIRKLWLNVAPPIPGWGWIHVTTADEAIGCLRDGTVTHLALDHAPHATGQSHNRTDGLAVLSWLEEAATDRTLQAVPWLIVAEVPDPLLRAQMQERIERLRAAGHTIIDREP